MWTWELGFSANVIWRGVFVIFQVLVSFLGFTLFVIGVDESLVQFFEFTIGAAHVNFFFIARVGD